MVLDESGGERHVVPERVGAQHPVVVSGDDLRAPFRQEDRDHEKGRNLCCSRSVLSSSVATGAGSSELPQVDRLAAQIAARPMRASVMTIGATR